MDGKMMDGGCMDRGIDGWMDGEKMVKLMSNALP